MQTRIAYAGIDVVKFSKAPVDHGGETVQLVKTDYDTCENHSVVCCRAEQAAEPKLASCKFDCVLVDCTSMVEPQVLIPIMANIDTLSKVVLVGDRKQSHPDVPEALKGTAYGVSILERLAESGMAPICTLKTQYRMHPAIASISSHLFYNGQILNGVTADERPIRLSFPNPEYPMMFINTEGVEKDSTNEREATAVCDLLHKLYQTMSVYMKGDEMRARSIAIIAPYASQCECIISKLKGSQLPADFVDNILISTIDDFQTTLREYVIVSCVHTNESDIGLLKDKRRVNVALTRASLGLFIVGSRNALSGNEA